MSHMVHMSNKKDRSEERTKQITRTKTDARNIFAVDRECWNRACDVGLNAAVAYLVLARGTGGDNRTTSWSARSIESHTGIGRDRAPKAIAALKDAGLIVQIKGGRSPRYAMQPAHAVPGCESYCTEPDEKMIEAFRPSWLWLSNDFVTKPDWQDTSLLENIRRMRSVDALRLFVNLHADQTFGKEGGLHWREGGIRQFYDRTKLGKVGNRVVWAFRPRTALSIDPAGFAVRHGDGFEAAFAMLREIGAVAIVPHLVDDAGYEAEMIHVLADPEQGGMDEAHVNEAAMLAAQRLLGSERIELTENEGFTRFVPLSPALEHVQVVGIARLACPPAARLILEWEKRNSSEWSRLAYDYHDLKPAISRSLSRSSSTS